MAGRFSLGILTAMPFSAERKIRIKPTPTAD
jgi:hypothetical protein